MFKKSEEQEWTRFRGALSKDRDEHAADPSEASTATVVNSATTGASGTTPSPGLRTPAGDVNVTIPTRLSRSVGSDSADVESLIGEHTSFEGTLKCEGSLRVLGTVQGEIHSKGTIIIEDKAHVTARLTAAQVTIAGQIDGQVYCEGRVEIRPTGRVTGEISAGALIVQEGAFFDGSSKMAVPAASQQHAADGAPSAQRAAESTPAPAGAARAREAPAASS